MAVIPKFDAARLEALCDILADTSNGLTGSEIGKFLAAAGILDLSPLMTKRIRLFEALRAQQDRDGYGHKVGEFVETAMNPVRYTQASGHFEEQRSKLNIVLAFSGMELGPDGKLRRITPAATLSEAEERAGRLRSELIRRRVHANVLTFCRPELLQHNFFHAVLEAAKSLAERLRQMTGLVADGHSLVDQAMGNSNGRMPLLALNTLRTDTERSIHTGVVNMLKGVFSLYRNPTAHTPKILSDMKEEDALEALAIISMLHRWVDQAVPTPALSTSRT